MNRSGLYGFLVIICIVFCGIASGENVAEEKKLHTEIIKEFETYRLNVNFNDGGFSGYFSKKINEVWLDWLLEERDANRIVKVHNVIESRSVFSRRIKKVFEYKIKLLDDDVILSIIYSGVAGKKYATYNVTYTHEYGRWLIDHVGHDTTQPGSSYKGAVIKEFQ